MFIEGDFARWMASEVVRLCRDDLSEDGQHECATKILMWADSQRGVRKHEVSKARPFARRIVRAIVRAMPRADRKKRGDGPVRRIPASRMSALRNRVNDFLPTLARATASYSLSEEGRLTVSAHLAEADFASALSVGLAILLEERQGLFARVRECAHCRQVFLALPSPPRQSKWRSVKYRPQHGSLGRVELEAGHRVSPGAAPATCSLSCKHERHKRQMREANRKTRRSKGAGSAFIRS